MCDKCGGTGSIREQINEFDRAKFRTLFDNSIESFEKAREMYDAAETDTDALLLMGSFYMKMFEMMETNLDTLMRFSVEELAKDPTRINQILARAMNSEGRQN